MSETLARVSARTGFCASFARAVITYVVAQGVESTHAAEALGYSSPNCLDKVGQKIKAAALSQALNIAAGILRDEHVGLRIGMGMKLSHLGAVGYSAMTAPSALCAMKLFEEFQQLYMTELDLRHESSGACVHARLDKHRLLPHDYAFWSFLLACRLNLIRGAAGHPIVPVRVDLPCARPRCGQLLQSFVGASVHFDAPAYGEWFRPEDLREPNPHSSPDIHLVMTAMARRALRESCDPHEWLIERLKGAIHHALERGENPTLGSLAPKMPQEEGGGAITARQLQRRLTSRRQSFRELVGEVRRERALAQLRATDRPLADIAAEAGYAELSSFHRAVRRWTGLTPMSVRQACAGPQEQNA